MYVKKCVSASIANLDKWIGHASKYKKILSNAHFVIVYKVRICMYTRILLTLVCYWFDAWISSKISEKLKTLFFSKFMYQLSPQIKLWGGDGLKMIRSEEMEKSHKTLYLCIVLCHKTLYLSIVLCVIKLFLNNAKKDYFNIKYYKNKNKN